MQTSDAKSLELTVAAHPSPMAKCPPVRKSCTVIRTMMQWMTMMVALRPWLMVKVLVACSACQRVWKELRMHVGAAQTLKAAGWDGRD